MSATVMTLSVIEGHSPIKSLFRCDIFALVLLFLDLLLLLHVYVQIDSYLLTYLLTSGRARHIAPMDKVRVNGGSNYDCRLLPWYLAHAVMLISYDSL